MDLSPQAWTAVWATVALIALLAVLCFGPPLIERLRAEQYRRWDARCAEDEKQWWLMDRLNKAAQETAEPGMVPAPVEPESRLGVGGWVAGLWRRPLAALKARNAHILDERERQANR